MPGTPIIRGLIIDPIGFLSTQEAIAHVCQKGWHFHIGALPDEPRSPGVYVSYQPALSGDALLASTQHGYYHFLITGSTVIPEGAVFPLAAVRMGTGMDNMRAIASTTLCLNTPGLNAVFTAERLLASLCQYRYAPDKLAGKKIAILGVTGAIGSQLATRALALKMHVIGWGRSLTAAKADDLSIDYAATLEDAVKSADIICPLVALTVETRHLLNAALFQHMQPHVIILNFGRVPLIDYDAAARFLVQHSGSMLITDADIFQDTGEDPSRRLLSQKEIAAQVFQLTFNAAEYHPIRVRQFQQAADKIEHLLQENRI